MVNDGAEELEKGGGLAGEGRLKAEWPLGFGFHWGNTTT